VNYIIKFTAATTGGNSIMYDTGTRIGVGTTAPAYLFQANGDIYANGGWVRVSGNQGLYFESWGGGWYMTDGTWLRSYNGKPIYTSSDIRADGVVYWGNGLVRTETKDDPGLMGSQGARSGFFETSNPNTANFYPGASSWQHYLEVRHSNNGNNYAFQIGGSFFDQDLWYRKTNNNGATTWLQLIGAGPRNCTAPFNWLGATVTATVGGITRSNTICLSADVGTASFNDAQNICAAMGGHIPTYNEMYRIAQLNNNAGAPVLINGDWLGNRAGDDQAYCVNGSGTLGNFEGTCNKNDNRFFRCAQSSEYVP
jgi:hypothetical protein